MRQVIARTLRAAVALVTLTLAQSAYWSPSAPWLFSVLVTALGALTAWRPAWGLVALAGLAPFGRMLAIVWLGGFPIRGAEALALACLAGAAVRWTVRPGTATDLPARVTIPWLLFAASAVASAAVLYRVSQVHLDYPAVFAERLLTFLAVGYHDLPGDPRPWAEPVGFGYVVATASVVEGVALLLVAGRLCVQSAAFARHLVVASVVAGAAAAALSMAAVSDAAATSGAVLDTLLRTIWTERWTVHVNKLNAAGSYFVLVCALGIGLAVLDRGRRLVDGADNGHGHRAVADGVDGRHPLGVRRGHRVRPDLDVRRAARQPQARRRTRRRARPRHACGRANQHAPGFAGVL